MISWEGCRGGEGEVEGGLTEVGEGAYDFGDSLDDFLFCFIAAEDGC